MASGDQRIRTVGELVDLTTPKAPDPTTGKLRDASIYRGGRAAETRLFTSLDRLGGLDPPHAKAHVEAHLLRNFARYSRPYAGLTEDDSWELLVLAQHHGLPTRLLDWSYSPLVAAHFACASVSPRGGEAVIWRLDWKRVHERFDLPLLALSLDDLDEAFGGGEPFSAWRLFEGAPDLREFACLLQPPSLDERIVAQSAAFTICSDTRQTFDQFLEAHELASALSRLVMPAEVVGRIRDQLDLAGFDERRLFPDLDGVATYLERYYS